MFGSVSGKTPCPKLKIYGWSLKISKYFKVFFFKFSLSLNNIFGSSPPWMGKFNSLTIFDGLTL